MAPKTVIKSEQSSAPCASQLPTLERQAFSIFYASFFFPLLFTSNLFLNTMLRLLCLAFWLLEFTSHYRISPSLYSQDNHIKILVVLVLDIDVF